jgi:hypothetical protein
MNGTEIFSFKYPGKISARLVLHNERFLRYMAEIGNKEIERSVGVGSISGDALDAGREKAEHICG